MQRAYCQECKTTALILDGLIQCCDSEYFKEPKAYERMSNPEGTRRLPTRSARNEKLKRQENRCFYCDRLFGNHIFKNGKLHRLRVHWDHTVPFSYSQDNRADNFVAACNVCNLLKHDKLFTTAEEARAYLAEAWKRKNYSDVC